MPNKSVSTIQLGTPLTGSTLMQVATGPVSVIGIEGNVSSTTGNAYFIQLLGTATPSSGSTIPLYSRQVVVASQPTQVNGFSFYYTDEPVDTANMNQGGSATTYGSNNLPVYAAVSSTDGVWTSVAASTDCTVVIAQPKIDPLNETQNGPSSAVDSLAVYTNDTTKRMTRFSVTNNSGATAYLMLFGYAPAVGAFPVQQWTLANGQTLNESFGNEGLQFQQGNPTTYALGNSCLLYGSSTTQTLTNTVGGLWNMTAWYNTNP